MPKYPLDDRPREKKPSGFLGKGRIQRVAKDGTITISQEVAQSARLAPGSWVLVSFGNRKVVNGEVKSVQGWIRVTSLKPKDKGTEEFFKFVEKRVEKK